MKRRVLLTTVLALFVFGATPASGERHAGKGVGCHSARCVERVARKRCWKGSTHACIVRAAMHWHVSVFQMDTVIECESGHHPDEVTPPFSASGLGQFLPSTWRTTPYGRHPILSAHWNALGTAWQMARHGLGAWLASRGCWGRKLFTS